jgi:hypothetical protein
MDKVPIDIEIDLLINLPESLKVSFSMLARQADSNPQLFREADRNKERTTLSQYPKIQLPLEPG